MPLPLAQKVKYAEGDLVAMKMASGGYLMGIVVHADDERATVNILKNGFKRTFLNRDLFFLNKNEGSIVQ